MVQHRLAAIRGHDAQFNTIRVIDTVAVRFVHGTRMKGGDLVIIHIGRDIGLCGIGAGHLSDEAPVYAAAIHPFAIGRKVVAHSTHGERIAS